MSSYSAGNREQRLALILLTATFVVSLGMHSEALADVVRLKNGGQIRGEVHKDSSVESASEITIVTLSGAAISLDRDDVAFVSPRSLRIEEYETRARAIPDTVEAHWELAEWARVQHLLRQREEQLEYIVRLDPDHEPAQRGLGRSLHNGKWMTRHDVMTSRGYIRHRGKYITQQELDLINRTDVQRQAEQVWRGKVRLWFSWATGRDESRRKEGMQKLEEVSDPDAIPALVAEMAEHNDREVRLFLVKKLSEIPDPRTVLPLVQQSLDGLDGQVREAAIAAIDDPRRQSAIGMYVSALQNDARQIVRRAGYALGKLGDKSVIPALISALVTQHQYRVTYKEATPSYALGSDGSIGFARNPPLVTPEVEALARTGQLPHGAIVIPPPTNTVTKTTVITRAQRNTEVLDALKSLSGENFGFDERTWQLWWAANQNGTGWTDG